MTAENRPRSADSRSTSTSSEASSPRTWTHRLVGSSADSAPTSRPSLRTRSSHGATSSPTAPPPTLTASGTNSPASASRTLAATSVPARSCASAVDAPRCGVTTTCGSSNSGLSVHGSVANTSRPAPRTCPLVIASASACSSISPPRAALTMMTPGLVLASASLPIRPAVSFVFGRCTEMKSARPSSSSRVSSSMPSCAARAGRHVRVIGDDVRAERGEPLGDQLADAAESDDTDGLAEDLGAGELRALPRVLAQRGVGGGDLPSGGEQQRQGVFGGAVDVGGRRVDDQHTARGGGVDVDVVQADAGPGDDLELGRRRQAPRRRRWSPSAPAARRRPAPRPAVSGGPGRPPSGLRPGHRGRRRSTRRACRRSIQRAGSRGQRSGL